jgi:hypothetical protein
VAVAAALLVVVVPAAINPGLERPSNLTNRVGHLYPRATFDQITDPVLERRDEIDEPITVMGVGGPLFDGTSEGVAVELADHGMDVVFGRPYRWYVHDDHLLDRNPPGAALVLFTREPTDPVDAGDIFGGEVLDRIDVDGGFDREAFTELADQARDATPRPGDELEAYSASQIPLKRISITMMLDDLVSEPETILVNRDWVRFLRNHPPESPRLDPELLERVDTSWPRSQDLLLALDVEVRLVQGDELSEVLRFGRVINPPLD